MRRPTGANPQHTRGSAAPSSGDAPTALTRVVAVRTPTATQPCVAHVAAPGGNSNSAGTGSKDWYNKNYGAMHMVYDARLNLKTSFTGKDLLYTRLRAGNFDNSPFDGNGFKLTKFDKAEATDNAVIISRLYYRFPVGKEFKFAVGPVARNTEFLGTKPFYYKGWSGLDFFQLFGAPGTYNKATGSLVGAIWKQKVKKGQPYFTASSSYVAAKPNGADGSRGIMTSKSEASTLTQLAYNANQWKASFGWNYTQCGNKAREGTQAAMQSQACDYGNKDLNSSGNALAVGLADPAGPGRDLEEPHGGDRGHGTGAGRPAGNALRRHEWQ